MKKLVANVLIAFFILLIAGSVNQSTKHQSASSAEALGQLTAQLLVFIGLFFSSRWRMKLSGHTYKVGRQTLAILLFWFSLFGLLGGLILPFAARSFSSVGIGLVMIALWGSAAYFFRKWLKRLRQSAAEALKPPPMNVGIAESREPSTTVCRNCNRENDRGSRYCSHCGKALIAKSEASQQEYLSGKSEFVLSKHRIPVMCLGFIGLIILYIIVSEEPFSFFFPERKIDQNVITGSVVNVLCRANDDEASISGGSGTIVSTNGMVITASHIIPQDETSLLTEEVGCLVILPNRQSGQPEDLYWARPLVYPELSDKYDLAFLEIYSVYTDNSGGKRGIYPRKFPSIFAEAQKYDYVCQFQNTKLGDPVRVFGYPQVSGGNSLTITDGIVSSLPGDGTILTSAKVDAVNSGGLAVDKQGCMIGIPSSVVEGKYQNLGVIISKNSVMEFYSKVSQQQ